MQESVFIGTPGAQIATVEVVGAGEATITMVHHRPLEEDVPPADTFTVQVIARRCGEGLSVYSVVRCTFLFAIIGIVAAYA